MAFGLIATIAFVFALQWARDFLVPLLLGIFIAYTLNPVVEWLERHRLARPVGATLVTSFLLVLLAGTAARVQDEFVAIADELPKASHKLAQLLNREPGKPGPLAQVHAAATELEQATARMTGDEQHGAARRALAPQAGANLHLMEWMLAGSVNALRWAVDAVMVVFLVYFFLLAGDTFKRKLVKLVGPSLSSKKITVQILDEINTSIQHYMLMLFVTNALLSVLMWIALRAIGLENAGAWAIFAGLVHVMPYFGPLLIMVATGVAAFIQFESLQPVLLVVAASLVIATLVGILLATWMTGRIARMNPAAVFVCLLFWGWLWGVWGLLLGVPLVVIVKVVAERVEGMEPVAELLGL